MTLLLTATAIIGWLVGYGVRGWEQREAERQVRRDAAVAAPDDGTFEAEYADAAYAEEWDDDLLGIIDALRAVPKVAPDGCWTTDHLLGACRRADNVIPMQRDGRRA